MGRGNVEIEIGNLARDVVEEARTVEPVDLDHGERIRERIVDDHLWLDAEGRQPRFGLASHGDDFGQPRLAREQALDRRRDPLGAPLFILGLFELAFD